MQRVGLKFLSVRLRILKPLRTDLLDKLRGTGDDDNDGEGVTVGDDDEYIDEQGDHEDPLLAEEKTNRSRRGKKATATTAPMSESGQAEEALVTKPKARKRKATTSASAEPSEAHDSVVPKPKKTRKGKGKASTTSEHVADDADIVTPVVRKARAKKPQKSKPVVESDEVSESRTESDHAQLTISCRMNTACRWARRPVGLSPTSEQLSHAHHHRLLTPSPTPMSC